MPRKPNISLPGMLEKTRRRLLAAAFAALSLAIFAAPAEAGAVGTLPALQSDLGHQLTIAGSHSGACVYDITAKQALYSARPTTMRPPASVEKLYTATAALQRLGPNAHLSPTVYGV